MAAAYIAAAVFCEVQNVSYNFKTNFNNAYSDACRGFMLKNRHYQPKFKQRPFKIRFAGRQSRCYLHVISERL
jgi:hypothetical protein